MNATVKIIAAFIALMVMAPASHAVERVNVDTKSLAAQVKDNPASRASLLSRFESGDRTLTPAQMAVVYYGEAFTPGHKPASSYPEVDAAYARKDYPGTLVLVDKVLESNPVALNQLFRGYVCSKVSADAAVKARATTFENRINNICDLIYATGTGVTDDSPFLVLSDEDALAFVRNYLQPTEILGTSAISGMPDMTAVKVKWPDQQDPVIFYFRRVR